LIKQQYEVVRGFEVWCDNEGINKLRDVARQSQTAPTVSEVTGVYGDKNLGDGSWVYLVPGRASRKRKRPIKPAPPGNPNTHPTIGNPKPSSIEQSSRGRPSRTLLPDPVAPSHLPHAIQATALAPPLNVLQGAVIAHFGAASGLSNEPRILPPPPHKPFVSSQCNGIKPLPGCLNGPPMLPPVRFSPSEWPQCNEIDTPQGCSSKRPHSELSTPTEPSSPTDPDPDFDAFLSVFHSEDR
jgi:hypothetical protein